MASACGLAFAAAAGFRAVEDFGLEGAAGFAAVAFAAAGFRAVPFATLAFAAVDFAAVDLAAAGFVAVAGFFCRTSRRPV